MKSSKTFNNISDRLKAEIPKLKPGEVVLFQMLNGVPNPEPDERERSKQPVLYGKVQVLTNFRIYDPYQKDSDGKEVGGYVDVGCVDQWFGEEPVKFRLFVPGANEYSRFMGKFQLQAGNVRDEELFQVLWLSPQREGSPCDDPSVEKLFKIVDHKADSKVTINKVDRLRKALEITANIKEEDARRVMSALNQPSYQDKEVLNAKVKEFAMNNVDLFIKTFESKDSYIKSDLREAMANGVLKYEHKTGAVKVGGAMIATLKVDDPAAFVDAFTKWIESAENGGDVLQNIKNQMKEPEKEAEVK